MDFFNDTHITTFAQSQLSATSALAVASGSVSRSLSHWGDANVDRTRGGVNADAMYALVTRCPRT